MATLVCFHAHPDDESIATGGTMAQAAAAGHRVVLVVATRGEHGEIREGVLAEGEQLGLRRVAETFASAEVLWAHKERRPTIPDNHKQALLDERQRKAQAVQAWFPHPDQPGKKAVLIGAHDPAQARFGTLELNLDGWFDYAIWDNAGDKPRMVAAERYSGRP